MGESEHIVIAGGGRVCHRVAQHSTKLVAGRRSLVAADQDVVHEVIAAFRGEEA